MFIKKFEAESLEQALSRVKSELGPNALILSTENKKVKWFQKPIIEVTAAFEQSESKKDDKESFSEDDLLEIFPHRQRSAPSPINDSQSIRKNKIDRYSDFRPSVPKPSPPVAVDSSFLRCGISPEVAEDLGRQLMFDYPKKDLDNPTLRDRIMSKMLIQSMTTLSPEILSQHQRWFAIGISGAGKTSLLVKIALYLKNSGVAVSLKSFDNQKLMGRRELASYARVIQAPYADSRSEVPLENGRVELSDSPALPLSDSQTQSEAIWEEIQRAAADRSVLLVLDGAMRPKEAIRVASLASAKVPLTAIAFTKLDLVSQTAVIYEVLRKTKLPLLGASISPSFRTPFKFFDTTELANLILRAR
jgi:flagellar biosynthesis protein FlhF